MDVNLGWRDRVVAAVYYCGLAPLFAKTRLGRAYREHHYEQALAVWFVLLGIIVLYGAFSLFLSYILVYHREWYEGTWVEPTLLAIVRRGFLCWVVVWAFSIFWALRGSWGPVPLLGRLAGKRWAMRGASVGCVVLLVTVLVTTAATAHAKTLSARESPEAQAFLLYDDMGFVPHWLFELGFYPIAREATSKWGRDSVVVRPLTPGGLAEALAGGAFVFVLSHGTEEGLYTREFKIRPDTAAAGGTGDGLQYVYLTGCDSGALAEKWERALAPAEVVTFDRLSAWLEHIWWLLFRGAATVRGLD